MGQKAAEMVIRQIENHEKSFRTLVLPTELIVRNTSERFKK
jgi:DNA-binding LacI/PurR family transcriptional regulator